MQFLRGFCCKSEELACEHVVIVKEESYYLHRWKSFQCKHEVAQYMFVNDGILDKIEDSRLKEKENHCRIFELMNYTHIWSMSNHLATFEHMK